MNEVNKIKIDLLELKSGDRILDIGCSYGEQAMMIAKLGFIVVGIDSSKKLIEKFNKLSRKRKLNCTGIVGNVKKMPFKTNSFDGLIATEVFEHIPEPQIAMGEAYRVLKKRGRACISVPTSFSEKIFSTMHPAWTKNSGHINVFTKNEILNILTELRFSLVRTEYHNFEWSIFWLIHSLLRTKFDETGAISENQNISRSYFRIWNYLYKLRMAKMIMNIGNQVFPKSIYVYVIKK